MVFKRILLVKPKGRKGLGFATDLIPIGLEYIAASIEDIADVRIIDMELEKKPFQHALETFRPDLVGITMSATDHNEGLQLAKIAKENGAATVLGGYHPTLVPDKLLAHPEVDMVIRGEGEATMRELVQRGSPKGISGVSHRLGRKVIHSKDRPLLWNLDSLPFPARHLRRHRYKGFLNSRDREPDVISMSRGCYGKCSFCCEPAMSKGCQRFRSPENVIKELQEIVAFHKGRPLQILAVDPNFMGDSGRIDRFCDLLHEHQLDITFSVMTRADTVVRNPELIKKMCKNGILHYEIGVESPNPRDIKNVKKGITPEMQQLAVKILRDSGASVSGTFVIGLPGQTDREIRQFPEYAKKMGLTNAAFAIATPFPGTEFYNNLEENGLISEQDLTNYDYLHSVFRLKDIEKERLEELTLYCMAKFWAPDTFINQAADFKERTGKKMPLKDFMEDLTKKLLFAKDAGGDFLNGNAKNTIKTVLGALTDSYAESDAGGIRMDSVVEMSKFLRVMGNQTMQFTLRHDGGSASCIIKTTGKGMEHIKFISGKHADTSIDFDIDAEKAIDIYNGKLLDQIKLFIQLMSAQGVRGFFNAARMYAAINAEVFGSMASEKIRLLGGGNGNN